MVSDLEFCEIFMKYLPSLTRKSNIINRNEMDKLEGNERRSEKDTIGNC